MTPDAWARTVKNDLVLLQQRTTTASRPGIPALGAAAHFCHEAFNSDGSLSTLAAKHANFAGLKWADWQAPFGCRQVTLRTSEYIDGRWVKVPADFCSCPDGWPQWLEVYAALLTGHHYGPALAYAADPLLAWAEIWRRGWATDPSYLLGISDWMRRLWPDYADTLPRPNWQPVAVMDEGGDAVATGHLPPDGHATGPVRRLLEWAGFTVDWDHDTRTVHLRRPPDKESVLSVGRPG